MQDTYPDPPEVGMEIATSLLPNPPGFQYASISHTYASIYILAGPACLLYTSSMDSYMLDEVLSEGPSVPPYPTVDRRSGRPSIEGRERLSIISYPLQWKRVYRGGGMCRGCLSIGSRVNSPCLLGFAQSACPSQAGRSARYREAEGACLVVGSGETGPYCSPRPHCSSNLEFHSHGGGA